MYQQPTQCNTTDRIWEGMHTLPLPLWVQRLFPIDPPLKRNVSEAKIGRKIRQISIEKKDV